MGLIYFGDHHFFIINVIFRLGIVLHFHDTKSELADLVILDPKWLARLMATLITTKRNFVKHGILNFSHLEQVSY